MKHSSRRILTTHVGSLVRPQEMVEILQRKEDGKPAPEWMAKGVPFSER